MVKNPEGEEVEDTDEDYEGLDDEDLEEEDLEALEKQEAKAKVLSKRKNLSTKPKQTIKNLPKPTKEISRKRFGLFSQEARRGIADLESGEVVGEGEAVILEVLSDVLERLERIETNLGSLVVD